jgi:hypothetical protein
MTNFVSTKFTSDLLQTLRQPSLQLDALSGHWPEIEKKISRTRRRLNQDIPKDDPIRLSVNLLAPIGRIRDENVHTRALAYLLDPSNPHGFRKRVLSSLIQKVQDIGPHGIGASKVLALLHRKWTKISVISEYRYRIEGFRHRSVARCDIWITLRARKDAAVVIIENKIDAPEGNGQLGWYERKAREWCKKNNGRALLVYLASEKREKDKWVSLSYLDLASALRGAWIKDSRAAGRAWLGLYIAAITGGVLGFDTSRLQDIALTDIEAYLGEGF